MKCNNSMQLRITSNIVISHCIMCTSPQCNPLPVISNPDNSSQRVAQEGKGIVAKGIYRERAFIQTILKGQFLKGQNGGAF